MGFGSLVPKFSKGQVLTATQLNRMIDRINQGLSAAMNEGPKNKTPLRFMEFTEDYEVWAKYGKAIMLDRNHYNEEGVDQFKQVNPRYERITDGVGSMWLEGERALMFYMPGMHGYLPIPMTRIVPGRLTSNLSYQGKATWSPLSLDETTLIDDDEDEGSLAESLSLSSVEAKCWDWLLNEGDSDIVSGADILCLLWQKHWMVIQARCPAS